MGAEREVARQVWWVSAVSKTTRTQEQICPHNKIKSAAMIDTQIITHRTRLGGAARTKKKIRVNLLDTLSSPSGS